MATIDTKKLKFTVIGRGYDDVRGNSGDGMKEPVTTRYGIGVSTACFDVTGRYLWLGCYGNGHTAGLLKYDIQNGFTEISHSVPTSASSCNVLHASTSENNLGLCMQGNNYYVFDLTDDTVVASGTVVNLPSGSLSPIYDVSLKDTTFNITYFSTSRSIPHVYRLDYDDESLIDTQLSQYQRAGKVFISAESIYMYYPAEWFYQNDYIESMTPSGSALWGASASGSFTNVQLSGFGANGKLYVPSYVNSKWRLGEYNGSFAPDFNTPSPKKSIGEFASQPTITTFAFSHEKKLVAFSCNLGVFLSDFENLYQMNETSYAILAVSDECIILDMGYLDPYHPSSIGIVRYS